MNHAPVGYVCIQGIFEDTYRSLVTKQQRQRM